MPTTFHLPFSTFFLGVITSDSGLILSLIWPRTGFFSSCQFLPWRPSQSYSYYHKLHCIIEIYSCIVARVIMQYNVAKLPASFFSLQQVCIVAVPRLIPYHFIFLQIQYGTLFSSLYRRVWQSITKLNFGLG